MLCLALSSTVDVCKGHKIIVDGKLIFVTARFCGVNCIDWNTGGPREYKPLLVNVMAEMFSLLNEDNIVNLKTDKIGANTLDT